jgi:N utilization substance protein A
VDELTEITGQSEDEAKALIMTARAHWFTDEAAEPAADAAEPASADLAAKEQ